MDYSSLYDLITAIRSGTHLQISVVFFGYPRNEKLILPFDATVHKGPYCWTLKHSCDTIGSCMEIREAKIKRSMQEKKPFWDLCIHGVREYVHPILIDKRVIGVIFIGNLLNRPAGWNRIADRMTEYGLQDRQKELLQSMESGLSDETCEKYGQLIESYIQLLIRVTPNEKYTEKKEFLINDLENYIKSNFRDPIDLETLSEKFHYNTKYLCRKFKQETGYSIKMYICRLRIENIKGQMEYSSTPITELAYQNGFNNITYFNRRFKEFTGQTPSAYRNALRQNS